MKRLFLLLIASLFAGLALAEDAVLRGPAGEYRLTDKPCTLPIALAAVAPQYAASQRAGRLEREGSTLAFCWIVVGDKVFALDETGEIHVGPIAAFRPAPGV